MPAALRAAIVLSRLSAVGLSAEATSISSNACLMWIYPVMTSSRKADIHRVPIYSAEDFMCAESLSVCVGNCAMHRQGLE